MSIECPKCGENLERTTTSENVHSEAWGVGAWHEESCDDPITCECGFFLDENEYLDDAGCGIKELIEDAGYEFNEENYLINKTSSVGDVDFPETWYENVTLELIDDEYAKPHEDIRFFIKGKRPEKFEAFEIWNGTKIMETI